MPQREKSTCTRMLQSTCDILRQYTDTAGKSGLLFQTANGTPHLYNKLEDRWLTPRLIKMGLDEKGMGWHSFKRFRKTWLRGARCLEVSTISGWLIKRKRCWKFYYYSQKKLKM